jgi:hypothetical protein
VVCVHTCKTNMAFIQVSANFVSSAEWNLFDCQPPTMTCTSGAGVMREGRKHLSHVTTEVLKKKELCRWM